MKLKDLVVWLDDFLRTAEIKDYPNAMNGLQLEGRREIRKVAVAVDACESTMLQAVKEDCDLLLVHHGMLWGGVSRITGACYRKLDLAITNGLAVYSSHLPLDLHPEVGNNSVLCRKLGMPPGSPFHEVLGNKIGICAEWKISLTELLQRVEDCTGVRPHCCPGGPGETRQVGVITGGAGGDVLSVASSGIDTFITGEGPHWTFTAAEELGLNLIYAGHYATETFGVRALGELIEANFGVDWTFLDHPTGL